MSKAYNVVRTFEEEIAKYAGAKYAVAVSSCTNAIFLCLKYLNKKCQIILPNRTYPGVAMAVLNAGYNLHFVNFSWEGRYLLSPLRIIDSALSLERPMDTKNFFYCLSFHYKKHLPIGRGGMILTDNKEAVKWLKMARWDGRNEGVPLNKDNASIIGWNMYMTPEQAARGLTLFDLIKDKDLPDLKVEDQNYPDLSKWRCFYD